MSAKSWIPNEDDFQSVRGSVGSVGLSNVCTRCGGSCQKCACSCTACNSCHCTPCHRANGTRLSLRR